MTNLSLYSLLEQKKTELGRPLKVVCDWDDCLMPLWPYIIWKASQVDCPFEGFFKAYFWGGLSLSEEEKKAVENVEKNTGVKVQEKLLLWQDDKDREKILKAYKKYHEFYEVKERFNAPFTTIAEDLLKALKKGLLEHLVVISSYTYYGGSLSESELLDNNGKANKFFKTFGRFSTMCDLELTRIDKDEKGIYRPERWKTIKHILPDFDILIDDKKGIIKETIKALANEKDKVYVLPNYQSNQEITGPNIYHVETRISNIKDDDFFFDENLFKKKSRKKTDSEGVIESSPWTGDVTETDEGPLQKINSLYTLIKQESQKKDRPLKIICDWDECLQPLKPMEIYETYKGKLTFEEFFNKFWENVVIEGPAPGYSKLGPENPKCKVFGLENEQEILEAIDKWKEEIAKLRKDPETSIYGSPEYIRKRKNLLPYLSIAKEIVRAYIEGLIDKLVIISSFKKTSVHCTNKRKEEKFGETFGHFLRCEFENTGVVKNEKGEFSPRRWQRIKEICPDFDIFIDDSKREISDTREKFSHDKNKVYVMPGYKNSGRIRGENVYHVKNTISDLKDEDFVKAAEEYKAKKEQELATRQTDSQRESLWKQPYLAFVGGVGICLLGLGIYWLFKKKIKKV